MTFLSLADARSETLLHLASYRTDRQTVHMRGRGARNRARLSRWTAAIEQVRALYLQTEPEKARLMDRLFGLQHPVPRCNNNRKRILSLAMDFSLSESTLYRWRDEIVLATMLAAAQSGALKPFATGD